MYNQTNRTVVQTAMTDDKGHPLVLTTAQQLVSTSIGYSHGFICNICRQSYRGVNSYHCKLCHYDMCERCFSKQNNCPGKHGLRRFHSPNNTYRCNKCSKSLPQFSVMYGCKLCNYDLCTECFQKNDAMKLDNGLDVPSERFSYHKDEKNSSWMHLKTRMGVLYKPLLIKLRRCNSWNLFKLGIAIMLGLLLCSYYFYFENSQKILHYLAYICLIIVVILLISLYYCYCTKVERVLVVPIDTFQWLILKPNASLHWVCGRKKLDFIKIITNIYPKNHLKQNENNLITNTTDIIFLIQGINPGKPSVSPMFIDTNGIRLRNHNDYIDWSGLDEDEEKAAGPTNFENHHEMSLSNVLTVKEAIWFMQFVMYYSDCYVIHSMNGEFLKIPKNSNYKGSVSISIGGANSNITMHDPIRTSSMSSVSNDAVITMNNQDINDINNKNKTNSLKQSLLNTNDNIEYGSAGRI